MKLGINKDPIAFTSKFTNTANSILFVAVLSVCTTFSLGAKTTKALHRGGLCLAGLIISNTALHNLDCRLWSQLEHGRSAVCFPVLSIHADKEQY